jgi:Right handed beta helix region
MKTLILRVSSNTLLALSALADPQAAWAGGAGHDVGAHTITVDIPTDAIHASNYSSLQDAANDANGKTIYIEAGTYPAGGLTINGPTRVIAYGATLKGNGTLSLSTPMSVEGIGVDGGGIDISGSGVDMSNCVVSNTQSFGAIHIHNAYNFTIDHCTVDHAGGNAGIEIDFSTKGKITNNKVTNSSKNGIQWWGGDADRRKVRNRTLGVSDITITGNLVTNNGEGGIWGSQGLRISVSNNTINTCGDVCLDFEGGQDGVGNNNNIHNGKNGGMTTFYEAQNIEFSHNTVVQDAGYGPGYRSYGVGVSQNIRILENTITTNGADGILLMGSTFIGGTITGNAITMKSGGQGINTEENTGNTIANNTTY